MSNIKKFFEMVNKNRISRWAEKRSNKECYIKSKGGECWCEMSEMKKEDCTQDVKQPTPSKTLEQ